MLMKVPFSELFALSELLQSCCRVSGDPDVGGGEEEKLVPGSPSAVHSKKQTGQEMSSTR